MVLHLPLVWALAATLAIVHFVGAEIDETEFAGTGQLTAIAAGVTITYVFLQLLPEHHKSVAYLGNFGFFFALSGFVALHLIKIYIWRHAKTAAELRHEYKELHSVFLFVYYLAIGIILNNLLTRSVLEGALFFVPVLLHTGISSLALGELHEDVLNNLWVKLGISSAVLIGVGLSQFIGFGPRVFHGLLAVITGMLLYIAVHDSIPDERNNAPLAFIGGIAVYSMVIIYTWMLV